MTIDRFENNGELRLILHGQIDTATAPTLEHETKDLTPFHKLYVDFTDVPYVSSAGLRVLLSARKALGNKEDIVLTGVNEDVMEILDMTGFIDFMTIQKL